MSSVFHDAKQDVLLSFLTFFLLLLAVGCGDDEPEDSPSICTAGETNCACTGAAACNDVSDGYVFTVCVSLTDCEGEFGCACNVGACDDGLICASHICTLENGLQLRFTGGEARTCDVLLERPDRRIASVLFPAGVRGRDRSRNERTALAFIRTQDTALTDTVAALAFEGTDAVDASAISNVSVTCYDRTACPLTTLTPQSSRGHI